MSGMLDGEWIVVRVADTGTAILEADQKKLFERLVTRKSGGTGLGLVLVRSLVEGHGGYVELESDVGRGTVFSVNLPVEAQHDYAAAGLGGLTASPNHG